MNIMKKNIALGVLLTILIGSIKLHASNVDLLTIETPSYKIELSKKAAWTIHKIYYKNKVVGNNAGFYGTVIRPKPGNTYVGTGHHEGGTEKVINLDFYINGEQVDINKDDIYNCRTAKIIKKSMIDKLNHTFIIEIDNDVITETAYIKTTEPQYLENMYAFMHCWLPTTTEWMAEDLNGKRLLGKFTNDNGWELTKDIIWTSHYDPTAETGVIVFYPEKYKGAGLRNGYWDRSNYHKLYFQPFAKETIPAGKEYSWKLIIKCFNSPVTAWKNNAEVHIDKLKEKYYGYTAKVEKSAEHPTAVISDHPDISFYVSFDNSARAVIAAGNPDYESVLGNETNEQGIKGNCAVIGEGNASYKYKTEKNINFTYGTIAMWVKPVNWAGKDKKYHFFFRTENLGGDYILFYKTPNPNMGLNFYRKGGKEGPQFNIPYPIQNWRENEWHHIAVTWHRENISLYIDGNKVKEGEMIEEMDVSRMESVFSIGNTNQMGSEGKTSIDEVYIYKRALNDEEIENIYDKTPKKTESSANEAEDSSVPKIIVTKCRDRPIIDGKMDPGEWDWSTAITGFVRNSGGIMQERQAQVWMTYDNSNLYFAFKTPVPEGVRLKKDVKNRDGKVYVDDAIEIYIQPDLTKQIYYQFIGNSVDAILDIKHQISGYSIDWNGRWQYKNNVTANSWISEISVPFEDLGVKKIRNGAKWGLRLCRDWQNPQIWTSWPEGATFGNTKTFSRITFKDKGPVIRMLSVKDIFTKGKVKIGLEIGNLAPETEKYKIKMKITALGKTICEKKEFKTVASGEKKEILIESILPEPIADRMNISVISEQTGQKVYSVSLPLEFGEDTKKRASSGIKKAFWQKVRFYPTHNLLGLEVDYGNIQKSSNIKKIAVEIKHEKKKRVLKEFEIIKLNNNMGKTLIGLPVLSEGKYEILTRLIDEKGKARYEEKEYFKKLKNPVWLGKKLGVSSKVLPPWTPMKVTKNKIKCWGREYGFGDNSIVSSVKTAGKDILAGPITLKCNNSIINMPTKILSKAADKVVLQSSGKTGNLEIKIKSQTEYDGVMKVDITLMPENSSEINNLFLNIPIKEEFAGYFHYVGDFGKANSDAGSLPEGTGQIWDSKVVKKLATHGGFIPFIWLGDEERGFCWFADTYKDWIENKDKPTIEIIRQEKEVNLRIHFITGPYKLKNPVTYTFGLLATPVKPLPKGWRGWVWKPIFPYNYKKGNMRIFWPCHYYIKRTQSLESQDDKETRSLVEEDHKKGIKSMPYIDAQATGKNAGYYKYYKNEWAVLPLSEVTAYGALKKNTPYRKFVTTEPDDYTYVRVCLQDSFVDYLLWSIKNMVEKWDVDGVYFDQIYPTPCTNTVAGCSYKKAGKVHPRFRIFQMRDFMKRVCNIFDQYGKDPRIVLHMSATMVIPSYTFGHIALNGEHFINQVHNYYDYEKLLSPDKVIAEFIATNYGLTPLLLPQVPYRMPKKTEATRNFLAITLLNDMQIWPGRGDRKELIKTWNVKQEFGIGDDNVKYYPYWNNEELIKPSSEKVKVSIYVKPGKGLIIISNFSDNDLNEKVLINSEKLGLKDKGLKAFDGITKEPLEYKNSHLTVPIIKHNFRMIIIEN